MSTNVPDLRNVHVVQLSHINIRLDGFYHFRPGITTPTVPRTMSAYVEVDTFARSLINEISIGQSDGPRGAILMEDSIVTI